MAAPGEFPNNGPKCVIYKITNVVNWKGYVGQTTTGLGQRVASYRYEARSTKEKKHLIADAIAKYGLEHFIFQIIEVCKSISDLDDRERFWIAACGTRSPRGYNLTPGGSGHKSITPETRLKMSLARKGKPGRPLTDEHKKKMLQGRRNSTLTGWSDERRRQYSVRFSGSNSTFFGKKHSDVTKEKIRKGKLGIPVHDDEWKQEHSLRVRGEKNYWFGKTGSSHWNFGKQLSPETKKKIGAANSKLLRGMKHSEARRANTSIVMKRWWENRKKVKNV